MEIQEQTFAQKDKYDIIIKLSPTDRSWSELRMSVLQLKALKKQTINKTFNYMKSAYKINKKWIKLEKNVKKRVDETEKIWYFQKKD